MEKPRVILLFSGKRKSGKDFICEKIKSTLGEEKCTIIRISGPLKGLYAKEHGLDWSELMSDGPYKEKYRLDMINWSEEMRKIDPGYFCKSACMEASPSEVWIVSDIRRKTDIKWFRENYKEKNKMIRIEADLETRKNRGWVFIKGVDDISSECDLDDYSSWDLLVFNNDENEFKNAVENIIAFTTEKLQAVS